MFSAGKIKMFIGLTYPVHYCDAGILLLHSGEKFDDHLMSQEFLEMFHSKKVCWIISPLCLNYEPGPKFWE